jgi:hypothetical protein
MNKKQLMLAILLTAAIGSYAQTKKPTAPPPPPAKIKTVHFNPPGIVKDEKLIPPPPPPPVKTAPINLEPPKIVKNKKLKPPPPPPGVKKTYKHKIQPAPAAS